MKLIMLAVIMAWISGAARAADTAAAGGREFSLNSVFAREIPSFGGAVLPVSKAVIADAGPGSISAGAYRSASAALPLEQLPGDLGVKFRFDLLTPTGEKIFRNSVQWYSKQVDNPAYPQPAKCAVNVSKVLEMSGLRNYSAQSVGQLLKNIVDRGGRFVKMPKDRNGIVEKLNTIYGGKIPAGTVVGGCLYSDCFTGVKGQRHSAVVSDMDKDGRLFLYHNNWYRPENEGGVWKTHMISKYFLGKGLKRQWMKTPWLKIVRNSAGKVTDIIPLLPAVDDLDPTQYFISMAIPKEIVAEVNAGAGRPTDPFKAGFAAYEKAGLSGNAAQLIPASDNFDVEQDDDGTPLVR